MSNDGMPTATAMIKSAVVDYVLTNYHFANLASVDWLQVKQQFNITMPIREIKKKCLPLIEEQIRDSKLARELRGADTVDIVRGIPGNLVKPEEELARPFVDDAHKYPGVKPAYKQGNAYSTSTTNAFIAGSTRYRQFTSQPSSLDIYHTLDKSSPVLPGTKDRMKQEAKRVQKLEAQAAPLRDELKEIFEAKRQAQIESFAKQGITVYTEVK